MAKSKEAVGACVLFLAFAVLAVAAEPSPATPASPVAPVVPAPAPSPGPVAPSPLTPVAPAYPDTQAASGDYQLYLKGKYTNPKWDSLVKEGLDQFEAGQAIHAVDFLQKAVAQGCSSPLVYMILAASYEFLGNPYTAVQYYVLAEKDLQSLPKDNEHVIEFDERFARALLANNQGGEAIPRLEKAAKTTKEYWVLSVLADHYLNQNNLDAALPILLQAVQVPSIQNVPAPEIAKVYLAIAKIYSAKGNKDESHRYIDYALQTDPNNQEAAALNRQISSERQQNELYQRMEGMMQWYKRN